MDTKLQKRITNGNKLIEGLKAADEPAPYADSILESARFNKLRILEAHVSNYSDDQGTRAQKINETDIVTGRNALHYLSYIGNTDVIQLLGATDQMKMNVLDAYDRNCMHYAAIHGKSTLINTLFLLFKQHGGKFERSAIDNTKFNLKQNLKADMNKINQEIES